MCIRDRKKINPRYFLNEEISKGEESKLKKISKQLANSSKLHKDQSEKIKDLVDGDESEVKEALVKKSEMPMRQKDDLQTVQMMSQEIKDMLKGLNSRELELARLKINNVLKSLSEELSEETIDEIMETVFN